jgi:hypothetical protein
MFDKAPALPILFSVMVLGGCNTGNELDTEIESIIAELEQLKFDVQPQSKIDRNGDGKPDFFVEFEDGYMYELVDRNFDGIVDESWKYDSGDNLVSGKVDENLDGILETLYLTEDYSFSRILSDTDANGVFDVYTKLDRGIMVHSEKYYDSPGGPTIGRVNYSYGHPTGPEQRQGTTLTEKKFEEERRN